MIQNGLTGAWRSYEGSDFSTLWFRFGGGIDFNISEKMYFRTSLLYGIRLNNKFEDDLETMLKDMFGAYSGNSDDVKKSLGHGLDVRVGIGFRL